jgi:thioredoxin reductase (NADPH)
MSEVLDVVIFGSGPSGHTAALYTSRANLRPTVFEGLQPGGQLTITTDVDNYPGFPEGVMGPELMERMKAQCERFGTTYSFETVTEVDLGSWPFKFTAGSESGYARAVIIATGASAKYLGLENEIRLQGYGVSACATCDGFFYQDAVVAVVGGGDSAAEEASFLTKFANPVHLLVRRDELRASKIMQQRVMDNDKIVVHWNTSVTDVLGDKDVTGITTVNNKTGETGQIDLTGFFLAIGHTPNSAPFVDWVDTDETGYILTAPDSTATKVPGVFAAGDVQDHVYRQAITAAGSGCMAALEAERWLENKGYEALPRRAGFEDLAGH